VTRCAALCAVVVAGAAPAALGRGHVVITNTGVAAIEPPEPAPLPTPPPVPVPPRPNLPPVPPVPPVPPAPPVVPAPATGAAIVLCGRPVVLTDVTLRRRRVRLGGVARPDYAGRPVTIAAGGRIVARTSVAADGTFQATARRTARSASLRYRARVPGGRSPALQATRLLIVDGQQRTAAGVRVRGHVAGRPRVHRTIVVARRLGCSARSTRRVEVLRTDARGRFAITLPQPAAADGITVYRLRTAAGGRTSTLLVLRAV
jgi:hypothetical protein